MIELEQWQKDFMASQSHTANNKAQTGPRPCSRCVHFYHRTQARVDLSECHHPDFTQISTTQPIRKIGTLAEVFRPGVCGVDGKFWEKKQ